MITTSNENYYKRMKLLRQHAMSVDNRSRHLSEKIIFEDHVEVGYNYRMTDIQGAIGLRQLEKLDRIIDERRKIVKRYLEELKDVDCIRLPIEADGYFSNYQSFSIYLKKNAPLSRNELMQRMLDAGISTRRGIMNAHKETAYKIEYENVKLPLSEDAANNSIMIPLYIPMSDDDITKVITVLRDLLKN